MVARNRDHHASVRTIFRSTRRSYKIEAFQYELQNSLLCDGSIIASPSHPDEMVTHYNYVITNLLDLLAPIQQVTCR